MNVALVRLSALGDVVHGLPVATALRGRWPDARITWIVERRHGALLQGHRALDAVIAVDGHRWRNARRPSAIAAALREIAAVRRQLRDARFDVAIDLQGLLKSGLMTAATGAPRRIGFTPARCRESLSALLTNRHVAPPSAAVHVVDQNLALLGALDLRPDGEARFDIPVDTTAETRIDDFFTAAGLKPRDGVVVLNPGAGRSAKRWPAERFAELARRIITGGIGKVLVVWGPGESDLAASIVEGCRSADALIAPATDVHGLVAVLRRASVMVSGDSGPLHVAAALGVRCVGLYGPTSARRNGPYGTAHRTIQGADGTLAAIGTTETFALVAELIR